MQNTSFISLSYIYFWGQIFKIFDWEKSFEFFIHLSLYLQIGVPPSWPAAYSHYYNFLLIKFHICNFLNTTLCTPNCLSFENRICVRISFFDALGMYHLPLEYCGLFTGHPVYFSWNLFYMLLFHSLFKVEFDIDHFVLGEHRER